MTFPLPLFNPNRLPPLLLFVVMAASAAAVLLAVNETGAGDANAGVSGTGGSDWKLASLGGGAKVFDSSSPSLDVSTHWFFLGSHTI